MWDEVVCGVVQYPTRESREMPDLDVRARARACVCVYNRRNLKYPVLCEGQNKGVNPDSASVSSAHGFWHITGLVLCMLCV